MIMGIEKNKQQLRDRENEAVELDYQRLAEAIVKAEIEVKNIKRNKQQTKGIRSWLMGHMNGMLYAVGYLFCIGKIITLWRDYSTNVEAHLSLFLCVVYTVLLSIIGIIFLLVQNENHDDDYNDRHDFFNINISLVALIVAIISLIRS